MSHLPLCPADPSLFPRHGNLQDLAVVAVNEDKALEKWRENAAGEDL